MEYYDYKIARNLAWKVLIECDIREFSVNLAKIINHLLQRQKANI